MHNEDKSMKKSTLIVSLDYELFWGMQEMLDHRLGRMGAQESALSP